MAHVIIIGAPFDPVAPPLGFHCIHCMRVNDVIVYSACYHVQCMHVMVYAAQQLSSLLYVPPYSFMALNIFEQLN